MSRNQQTANSLIKGSSALLRIRSFLITVAMLTLLAFALQFYVSGESNTVGWIGLIRRVGPVSVFLILPTLIVARVALRLAHFAAKYSSTSMGQIQVYLFCTLLITAIPILSELPIRFQFFIWQILFSFDQFFHDGHWLLTSEFTLYLACVVVSGITGSVVAILVLKHLLFPRQLVHVSSDGVTVELQYWSSIFGQKLIKWNEVKQVTASNNKIAINTVNRSFEFNSSVDHIDIPVFLTAIRTHAPHGICANDIGHYQRASCSFTRIWLKSLANEYAAKASMAKLEPGDVLNNGAYQIVSCLGQGSTSVIYKAIFKSISPDVGQKLVVLKEYTFPTHMGRIVVQSAVEAFTEIGMRMASLQCPYLPRFYDSFIENHRGYMSIEFVEGQTLRELISINGPIPQDMAISIVLQLCKATKYLHGKQPCIVHGDISPENVIFKEDASVVLIDLHLFKQSGVRGKLPYLAKEQLSGPPTEQSDLYSICAVLYFLLTAQEPLPFCVFREDDGEVTISPAIRSLISRCTSLVDDNTRLSASELEDLLLQVSGHNFADEPDQMEPSILETDRIFVDNN